MSTLDRYLDRIRAACPGLQIAGAALHTTGGQFNDIVFVNDNLVVRFPRNAHVAAGYASQAAMLAHLKAKLPLPIPELVYSAPPGAPWQEQLLGYRRLPGRPCQRAELDALAGPGFVRELAAQLAGFLRALHELPLDELPMVPPLGASRDYWAALYAGFRAELFPLLRPDIRDAVARSFERLLADQHAYQPALIHGDFGPGNVLIDLSGPRIGGVIDFESLGVGDPATDVAALSCYGEDVVRWGMAAYPAMADMLGRARFYRGTFALQEAYYGLRDGDDEAVARGLAGYT